MSAKPITIVCVKHGEAYGPEYVNILFNMVCRNLPAELIGKCVCFTDNAEGIDRGIEIRPLPEGISGWWNKLYLFKKGLFEKGERILYLDLDTAITGALDDIASYGGNFAILRDFYRPDGLQSSVMAWSGGFGQYIWDAYQEAGRPNIEGGDQAWIEICVDEYDLWQDLYPGNFVSYKVHCKKMFPKGARVVVFHGYPRPHQVVEGWVPQVWKVGGGTTLELVNIGNVDEDRLIENIRSAIKLPYNLLESKDAHDGHAVIVGGGPSLADNLGEIKLRHDNNQIVFSTNGSFKFLSDNGIIPDYHVMLDARRENIAFVPDSTACLYSSQLDPDVFTKARDNGNAITLWHSYADGIQEIIADDPRATAMVGGGSSVGLKAICVAYIMGYRNIHIYGMDSSYRGNANHAYAQPLNDGERVIDVTCNGISYKAAAWMATQVDEFKELASQLVSMECTITVHGDGLLPDVARLMHEDSIEDTEMKLIDGLWWPSRDIECRASVNNFIGDVDKILSFCDKREVVVQAGGNVGAWPKEFAKHFRQVITFEPDNLNYACLEKNVTEENVIKINAGLGDKHESVRLQKAAFNCGAHYINGDGELPIIPLDSMKLSGCNLLQLDIEGYEIKALQGAIETIKKYRPVIVLEDKGLSERYGAKQGAVIKLLESHNYELATRINRDVVMIPRKTA